MTSVEIDPTKKRPGAVFNFYQQNFIQVNNIFLPGYKAHEAPETYAEPKATPYAKGAPAFNKFERNSSPRTVKPSELASKSAVPTLRRLPNLRPIDTKACWELREEDLSAERPNSIKFEEKLKQDSCPKDWCLISDQNISEMVGYLLVTGSVLFFVMVLFWTLFAKFIVSVPKTNASNPLVEFVSEDQYYCWLLPLLAPVTVVIIYCNWISMKFFRHN